MEKELLFSFQQVNFKKLVKLTLFEIMESSDLLVDQKIIIQKFKKDGQNAKMRFDFYLTSYLKIPQL